MAQHSWRARILRFDLDDCVVGGDRGVDRARYLERECERFERVDAAADAFRDECEVFDREIELGSGFL